MLRSAVAGGLVASSGCLTTDTSAPEHAGDDNEAIHDTALEVGLNTRPSVVSRFRDWMGGGRRTHSNVLAYRR